MTKNWNTLKTKYPKEYLLDMKCLKKISEDTKDLQHQQNGRYLILNLNLGANEFWYEEHVDFGFNSHVDYSENEDVASFGILSHAYTLNKLIDKILEVIYFGEKYQNIVY